MTSGPFHYHPCADNSRALDVLQRHTRSIEPGVFFSALGTVVEQPAPYFCVFATKGEIGIRYSVGRRTGDLEVAVIVLAARQREQGLVTCFQPHRGVDIAYGNTNATVVGDMRPSRMEQMPMVEQGLSRLKCDIDIIAFVDVDRELEIVAPDYTMTTCLSDAIRWAMGEIPNLRFDGLRLSRDSGQAISVGEVDLLCAGQVFEVEQSPNEVIFDDIFVCLVCEETGPEKPFDAEAYLSSRHVVVRYFENRMIFKDEAFFWREGLKRTHQIAVCSDALVPQPICGRPLIATIRRRIATQWPVKILPFP